MSEPWVIDETVGSALRRTAALHPDHDAVVFPMLGLRWSWRELDRRIDQAASGLIAHGVARGEHVGIWSMNAPEWVVTQFAVGRIGAVLVNVNPSYRLQELEQTLLMADVATLIVGCPFKDSNFVAMVETLCPELPGLSAGGTCTRLPVLRRALAIGDRPGPGWLAWSDIEAAPIVSELADRERANQPSDVYNIQFTSGTTGLPKGAMLTHRNVLLNAYYVGERMRYTPADRVCVPVPFYHCFGCVLGTLVCAVYGSALVAPAPSFDPRATLAAIDSERCTSLYGVPAMFVGELQHAEHAGFRTSSLRTGIMSGAPCPLPLMQRVLNEMGASEITIGYGQTEASPIITLTSVDDPIEVRTGTVGKPVPGLEVRLIDPATRREVATGETGELCVRGHCVMVGYYKAPEATARVIDADGWLATGDLARRREDGNYRIVGRCKELIIRGGENIYPPEIEEFLLHYPGIAEAAVLGLPDAKYGEAVAAWVVLKPGATVTEDALRDHCRGQIARYKVPKYIQIVDQLPRTVTGKVRKHVLRAQGIQDHGLESAEAVPTA